MIGIAGGCAAGVKVLQVDARGWDGMALIRILYDELSKPVTGLCDGEAHSLPRLLSQFPLQLDPSLPFFLTSDRSSSRRISWCR